MFDQKALNQLYRYCFTLTNHEEKAYDLLQTALEKFLSKPPQNALTKQAYIRRIIHNQFIDHYRREQKIGWEPFEEEAITDIDTSTGSLEEEIIHRDLLDKIWPLLDPFEREILYLWAVEGYTTQEVADVLETKKGTIVSRIHRLKIKLKQQFEGDVGSALS